MGERPTTSLQYAGKIQIDHSGQLAFIFVASIEKALVVAFSVTLNVS